LKIIKVSKIIGKISELFMFPWFFYKKMHPNRRGANDQTLLIYDPGNRSKLQ
jgi:hypothetical protein